MNYKKYGSRGHDRTWRRIFSSFGYHPDRCHSMDVSNYKRKQKTFIARCNCKTHQISSELRRNILCRCRIYRCVLCKGKIELT